MKVTYIYIHTHIRVALCNATWLVIVGVSSPLGITKAGTLGSKVGSVVLDFSCRPSFQAAWQGIVRHFKVTHSKLSSPLLLT